MSMFGNLGDLLKQVTGSGVQEADVHAAYDQVAQAVPQSELAKGLAHAFQSDATPPFEQMLSGLFHQSSPDQKAGILNQILGALGPNGVSQALSAAGLGGLTAALAGGSVSPAQAQQVSPDAVSVLAQQAAKKDPSIVDQAASFYAQHPTLVKTVGAAALAILMSKLSAARR